MYNRLSLKLVAMICCGLLLALPPAVGAQDEADHPTAEQLLEQGLQQQTDGELDTARETLKRVDPLQLSREQRVQLRQTMQDIDRQLQSQ